MSQPCTTPAYLIRLYKMLRWVSPLVSRYGGPQVLNNRKVLSHPTGSCSVSNCTNFYKHVVDMQTVVANANQWRVQAGRPHWEVIHTHTTYFTLSSTPSTASESEPSVISKKELEHRATTSRNAYIVAIVNASANSAAKYCQHLQEVENHWNCNGLSDKLSG